MTIEIRPRHLELSGLSVERRAEFMRRGRAILRQGEEMGRGNLSLMLAGRGDLDEVDAGMVLAVGPTDWSCDVILAFMALIPRQPLERVPQ